MRLDYFFCKNMTFKKYPKIHRLGKEEVEDILFGDCYIQEKIDGANTSIWIDKREEITCGSRNRELESGFNGFVDFVKSDDRIKKILKDNPTWRLYGEWLVKHSMVYQEEAYRKFYLFDITEVKDGEETEEFKIVPEVNRIAEKYKLDKPHYFGKFSNIDIEELKEMCGKSYIGDNGEGIVIKNFDFVDKWGNINYAKMVTEKFKEKNSIIFGGNDKHSETYKETNIMLKYVTQARVEKNLNKIQSIMDEKLDLKHIPRIMETVYHDILTEEIWDIQKKFSEINFRRLRRLIGLKTRQIFIEINKA